MDEHGCTELYPIEVSSVVDHIPGVGNSLNLRYKGSSLMPHGHVTAFFLFEVADAIDLPAVRTAIGATVAARIATLKPTPPYLQYQQPPVTHRRRGHRPG